MQKEFTDYVAELAQTHPELAGEMHGWHGMNGVLTWMQKRGLAAGGVDLVGHDEFEYDFLVESEPGRWLAFGVT